MLCNGLDSSETSKHVLYNGLKHVVEVARQAYSLEVHPLLADT